MPTHVYFDLDGTLTDPYEGITKCILYALDKLGFPHPTDEYLFSCIGPSLYVTFPEMVGEELTPQAIDLYRERFNDVGWLENVPYDGIHDALAAIADSGCTLFVATSKPRIAAGRIVEYFEMGRYFEKVYGCELDGTRSNKADLLKYAIGENPQASSRTMIGDRKHDLIGAIANGIRPVGVSYGYGSLEELDAAGATAIARTPAEIPGIIAAVIR
ncbi:MAG: HAD hydrolase-like protein [Woeseiaceae bacterium]|nr:HAD hydrolase-like protein [Woeseiaceae bacterium]